MKIVKLQKNPFESIKAVRPGGCSRLRPGTKNELFTGRFFIVVKKSEYSE